MLFGHGDDHYNSQKEGTAIADFAPFQVCASR